MESDVNSHMGMLTSRIRRNRRMSCISHGHAKAFIRGRLGFACMGTGASLGMKIERWGRSRTITM